MVLKAVSTPPPFVTRMCMGFFPQCFPISLECNTFHQISYIFLFPDGMAVPAAAFENQIHAMPIVSSPSRPAATAREISEFFETCWINQVFSNVRFPDGEANSSFPLFLLEFLIFISVFSDTEYFNLPKFSISISDCTHFPHCAGEVCVCVIFPVTLISLLWDWTCLAAGDPKRTPLRSSSTGNSYRQTLMWCWMYNITL